jgi:hypothetical protein
MTAQHKETLQQSIARQRENLAHLLQEPLQLIAEECSKVWGSREKLDAVLQRLLDKLPYGKFLYCLDTEAHQVSDNISHKGIQTKDFGRDRSQRPYMRELVPATGFLLSESYISLRAKRPSLTAIQLVRDEEGNALGFVGADFDLRDLPITGELYEEPHQWRQIKGDPAIRGTVFMQSRTESPLDDHFDEVIGVMSELIKRHGVFQTVMHFSSSRATIWLVDDPYRYRILDIDALIDPDICLAYPRPPYPQSALIPAAKVRKIMEQIRDLRLMDEMFYLRSCSINIFNGMISLTFSCDGTHYLPYDEFLEKDIEFWVGSLGRK